MKRDDILLNDDFGGIPLQIAVGFGSIQIVEMFLSHPKNKLIDINFKDDIFFFNFLIMILIYPSINEILIFYFMNSN